MIIVEQHAVCFTERYVLPDTAKLVAVSYESDGSSNWTAIRSESPVSHLVATTVIGGYIEIYSE